MPNLIIETGQKPNWRVVGRFSRATISGYKKGHSPSSDILKKIAKAFGYPPEFVMQKAGMLPEDPSPRSVAELTAKYKIDELNEHQLDEVIQFIEFIQDRDDRRTDRNTFIERHTGEGQTAPPDLVK